MEENNQKEGIFINGKAQIIEMLQFMDDAEKATLIKNIRLKNPALANELFHASLTFEHVNNLENSQIQILLNYISPAILGIALKGTSLEFQKRILGQLERSKAEKAYEVMSTPRRTDIADSKRAQEKVLETLTQLVKKRVIKI